MGTREDFIDAQDASRLRAGGQKAEIMSNHFTNVLDVDIWYF